MSTTKVKPTKPKKLKDFNTGRDLTKPKDKAKVQRAKEKFEIRKENDFGYEYERFFSYFTLSEFKDYFNKLGLEIISENVILSSSGRSNWINITGKKNK